MESPPYQVEWPAIWGPVRAEMEKIIQLPTLDRLEISRTELDWSALFPSPKHLDHLIIESVPELQEKTKQYELDNYTPRHGYIVIRHLTACPVSAGRIARAVRTGHPREFTFDLRKLESFRYKCYFSTADGDHSDALSLLHRAEGLKELFFVSQCRLSSPSIVCNCFADPSFRRSWSARIFQIPISSMLDHHAGALHL